MVYMWQWNERVKNENCLLPPLLSLNTAANFGRQRNNFVFDWYRGHSVGFSGLEELNYFLQIVIFFQFFNSPFTKPKRPPIIKQYNAKNDRFSAGYFRSPAVQEFLMTKQQVLIYFFFIICDVIFINHHLDPSAAPCECFSFYVVNRHNMIFTFLASFVPGLKSAFSYKLFHTFRRHCIHFVRKSVVFIDSQQEGVPLQPLPLRISGTKSSHSCWTMFGPKEAELKETRLVLNTMHSTIGTRQTTSNHEY